MMMTKHGSDSHDGGIRESSSPNTVDVSAAGTQSQDAVKEKGTSASAPAVEIGGDSAGPDSETEKETHDNVPNGGLRAWLQVAGAFCFLFNTWGIVNSYGVFQTYYQSNLLQGSSPDAISWIGSVQSFLLLGGGGLAGPLFDAGFFRRLLATGACFLTLGLMMTSLATQYWQVLLAQGFCIGIGGGCCVVPTLALMPQYFDGSRRALASGLAVAGGSVGGVVFPLVFTSLSTKLGFGWACRVMGFMALAMCAPALCVLRKRVAPRKVRSPIDPSAFREPAYLWYCGAMFLVNTGFFVPLFYLQPYALTHGMADQRDLALNLLAILNAASVLGRLAPAVVVGRLGAINTMLVVSTMAGVVAFCWIAVEGAAASVVFAVLFGFSSGGIVSLPPVVLASITADLRFMGARWGTSNMFNAVGSLIGTPIAGAILRSSSGGDSYLGLQLFGGFIIIGSSFCLIAARTARAGPGILVKA